ncbi:hypothetical protein [Desulfovibrio litoralis]|uniref:Uncharacterized protein n=1 Tax=Desulfovibrio litoralis DSM 11393 TaxID=1121455 RepID=A0A1M7RUA5_9BACT|nr:hypothetical protein [Desulfovibrio litoralis]SHN49859.1 hypothetical protein SAMN02745728_00178 [Desulfovibrio litoralis DSM 11393]
MKQMKDLKFKDEIQAMEYEPLNDTEVKLVRNSVLLGIGLIVIFYVLSSTFFPKQDFNFAVKPTVTEQH